MKHYVYKLEDKITGEFYFGSRTCKGEIKDDTYMGSPTVWKPERMNLVKTIIKENFKTRNNATKYEAGIIRKFIKNELNRNFSIPGEHSYKIGYVTVKDKNGKYHWIHNEDVRFLNGEVVGVTSGIPISETHRKKISKTLTETMSKLSDDEKREKFGSPGNKNPMFGIKRTDEWKKEQKLRMEEYYKTHQYSNEGKKFSKEWKLNISKKRKELGLSKGQLNPNWKGFVNVKDLDDNLYVYTTITEAANKLNVSRDLLSIHCKNQTTYQRGKYKGWKFEFSKVKKTQNKKK